MLRVGAGLAFWMEGVDYVLFVGAPLTVIVFVSVMLAVGFFPVLSIPAGIAIASRSVAIPAGIATAIPIVVAVPIAWTISVPVAISVAIPTGIAIAIPVAVSVAIPAGIATAIPVAIAISAAMFPALAVSVLGKGRAGGKEHDCH